MSKLSEVEVKFERAARRVRRLERAMSADCGRRSTCYAAAAAAAAADRELCTLASRARHAVLPPLACKRARAPLRDAPPRTPEPRTKNPERRTQNQRLRDSRDQETTETARHPDQRRSGSVRPRSEHVATQKQLISKKYPKKEREGERKMLQAPMAN